MRVDLCPVVFLRRRNGQNVDDMRLHPGEEVKELCASPSAGGRAGAPVAQHTHANNTSHYRPHTTNCVYVL